MSSSSSIIWLSLHHHLTWCHRRPITSSWNLSTNVSWSSSTFCALPGYRSSSWWERPSLPSMISVIIDHSTTFPPTQTCSCFVLYLEFLATQHCSSLPWILPPFMSRMSWEFHHLLGNSWYSDASHNHHSSLGPRVEWTLLWEFNISSNLATSELVDNNSNVVCWLLNFHSDVGRATQPIFRVPLSTNI